MASYDKRTPRRISRELKTVKTMITMYCNAHHHPSQQLCDECDTLWKYAKQRVHKCPFGEDKPTCANCTVHCYRKTMREKIREVMRYSGPRMALRHPVLTIFHFIDGRRPTPETRPQTEQKNDDSKKKDRAEP